MERCSSKLLQSFLWYALALLSGHTSRGVLAQSVSHMQIITLLNDESGELCGFCIGIQSPFCPTKQPTVAPFVPQCTSNGPFSLDSL